MKFNPRFLTDEHVIAIHANQIQLYGGGMGIRDLGLLQSAVAQPKGTFDGELLHVTLFDMAAAYLFHLVENHPFLDGNKRVGAAAAITFLDLNRIEINVDEMKLAEFVLEVAQGRRDKPAIAEFFRTHSTEQTT